MTGTHFWGCTGSLRPGCCGTYDRHNEVLNKLQTTMACFKYDSEWKFSGSTSSVDSNYVGISESAIGKGKHPRRMVRSGGAPSLSRGKELRA
jgi:hypothetical protein